MSNMVVKINFATVQVSLFFLPGFKLILGLVAFQ